MQSILSSDGASGKAAATPTTTSSPTTTAAGNNGHAAGNNGAPQSPAWLRVNLDAIPAALKERKHWLAWNAEFVSKSARWTKVPYKILGHGKASSTNPATWAPFSVAWLAVRRFNGVGFALSDGICGIDLDHCRNSETGVIEPWAREIVNSIPTCWEITPSGTGLRAFLFGKLPGGGVKKGNIEIYDQGRYLTVTGAHLDGTPDDLVDCGQQIQALYQRVADGGKKTAPPDDNHRGNGHSEKNGRVVPTEEQILAKAERSAHGDEFRRLWAGQWAGLFPSQSEADLKLMNDLVFWTGGDERLADSLFRRSSLMRPKWDERHFGNGATYGQHTLAQAFEGRTEFYDWTRRKKSKKRHKSVQDLRGDGDPGGIPTIEIDEGRTEVANGRRLVHLHGRELRWCEAWLKWLVWDGQRWNPDQRRTPEAWAKDVYHGLWEFIGAATGDDVDEDTLNAMVRFVKATGTARGVENMLKLARSEIGIAIGAEDLDADPWILNCANGTLDLQTGNLRPHCREELLTKLSPVEFDPAAACPAWLRFLEEITKGQTELQDFLRRAAGLSLTGDVREHVLLVCYGKGANGKSTFLNTLQTLLGNDYSMKAPPDLLMVKRGEVHPTERADLAGKRFVVCIETEEGRRLAEALVKELTGGDRIRARRMRENFWEFDPSHKLWLGTNHKPMVRGTDHGIWRRLKLIPFDATIPDERQDKTLPQKLRAELPGILNWAVQGCREWQADGLGEPPAVREATASYRSEMDLVGRFLDECCEARDGAATFATTLYQAFGEWAEETDGAAISQKKFGVALAERGFTSERCTLREGHGRKVWWGVALLDCK